jgi:hypothetical protein
MKISARLQITSTTDQRGCARRKLSLLSSLHATGEEATIHDISATGMLIETASRLATFDALELELPEAGVTPALVIWNSGRYYGCEFKEPISQAAISAALLRSPAAAPDDFEVPAVLSEGRPDENSLDAPEDGVTDEDRAPLSVRLRVIFGSAILLWALIIWIAVTIHNVFREIFGR